ncbi:MAG: lipid-binding protein [Flavobacteriales bacterium]|nr:lipid-binding protein [Flavobacteriales bacterium]
MKKIILLLAITVSVAACSSESKDNTTEKVENKTNTTNLNPIEGNTILTVSQDSLSVLKWTGSALGKSHFGTVNFKGSLGISEKKLISGNLEFDLGTINTQDLSGKSKQKLDTHLKSEDFFDINKYPKAYLVIKSFDGNTLNGSLTIKEITKEISFPAKLSVSENSLTGSANFKINRTEYGIVYNSDNFFDLAKDKVISDEIEFMVKISAIK